MYSWEYFYKIGNCVATCRRSYYDYLVINALHDACKVLKLRSFERVQV
jgi:hypothetical protein